MAVPSSDSFRAQPAARSKYLWFWLAFVALVYLGTIGFLPLVGRDEPRYVQIGREMFQSGDWITPRLGGFTWFEKPALLYWMVAASFTVFGVSEWAARLGPALCGLGIIALTWGIARSVNERWANWSAFALASSLGLLVFSRGATFDITLTFCTTLALYGWWKAQETPARRAQFLALFWFGVGLGFIAKGLVVYILILGTVALYSLLLRRRVALGLWWGLPLSLVVASVWYGPVILVNGQAFIDEFFIQHHFQRFTSSKYSHDQPIWFFFVEVMPVVVLPWTPFLIGALIGLWKKKSEVFPAKTPEDRLRVFAFAWWLLIFAFFTASGSKLPSYILPSIGAMFLLVGDVLHRWANTPKRSRAMQILGAAVLLIVAAITSTGPGVALAEKESVRSVFNQARQKGLASVPVVAFRIKPAPRAAQFYAAGQLLYGQKSEEPINFFQVDDLEIFARGKRLLVLVEEPNLAALRAGKFNAEIVAQKQHNFLVLLADD